jgi:hypothetical protein
MCKVYGGILLHPSTNPEARTTSAYPRMPNELLHGIILLEVFQVKECTCGLCSSLIMQDEERYDSQFGLTCILCYRALEIYGRVWE